MVPNTMGSAPLSSCVLHVPMVYEKRGQRRSYCFHDKCLPQHFLSCTNVAYIEMQPHSDTVMCTDFTDNTKEVPRRLSFPHSEVVVARLRLRAASRQQHFSASFRKTARQYFVLVQVQHRRKRAKSKYYNSPSPCRPRSAPILLQVLHDQLSSQSVPSSPSVSVVFVPLLVSYVDEGIPQRLALLCSQPDLSLKREMHELSKLFTCLLRRTTGIVQRLKDIP